MPKGDVQLYGESQPWPNVHGFAGLVINQENINLSVIDLHNLERARSRILPGYGLGGLNDFRIFALERNCPSINLVDAGLDCAIVRLRQSLSCTPCPYLLN